MIEAHRDITDRKEAEGGLARSNAKLAAQVLERTHELEAMHDAVVNAILTFDTRGAILSVNAAATTLLGYNRDEMIGQNVKMLMPEQYAREHDGYIGAYVTTGTKKIIGIGREVSARRKDGTTIPIHLTVSEFEANGKRHFTGSSCPVGAESFRNGATRDRAQVGAGSGYGGCRSAYGRTCA